MKEVLTTGQMIDRLKEGQISTVVANGYVGGQVYMFVAENGYKEIRWIGTENKLSIGGFLFETLWIIEEEGGEQWRQFID